MKKSSRSSTGDSRIQHMPVASDTAGNSASASSAGSGANNTSTTSTASIFFCPNMKLFEASGIQLEGPTNSITVAQILRLPSHTLLRAHISQQEWLGAAHQSFQLPNHVALRLFEVFYQNSVTKTETRIEATRILLEKANKQQQQSSSGAVSGGTAEEYQQITDSRTVSLPGFMLYLMAQMVMERPPRAPVGEMGIDAVISFIKQHLHEIITSVAVTKQANVSQADLGELSFMLREFANGVESPIGSNLGFLWARQQESLDISIVAQFIRQRLIAPQDVKGSAATNSQSVGSVRGVNSAVHFVSNAPAIGKPHTYFKIQRCLQSSIYITAPLPPTVISSMTNCVIVVGPVSGMLTIDRCDHCQIIALCGGISISNSKHVTFYVCSNSMPIIHTHNIDPIADEVRFAPYNTFYPTLEEHLTATGVNPMLTFINHGQAQELSLPVEQFTPITIPMAPQTSASVTTRTNPCPLPPHYAKALGERMTTFNDTSKLLQETYRQLETAGRRDLAESLRTKVHQMFMDWLHESGQSRGLVDLLNHTTVAAGN